REVACPGDRQIAGREVAGIAKVEVDASWRRADVGSGEFGMVADRSDESVGTHETATLKGLHQATVRAKVADRGVHWMFLGWHSSRAGALSLLGSPRSASYGTCRNRRP